MSAGPAESPDELPVAIGSRGRFEGLLSFRGAVRVDGELRGQVEAEGTLWLGPQARVFGRVAVDELVIEGQLEGEIAARQRVELLATARVRADLVSPAIALADGCRLDGLCTAGPTD